MELLERYLQAVRKYLPLKRQDDIIAELRANMESQIEDRESELNRPLTQGEVEDLLRKMGPPLLVASRYQPQQHLIGPTFFPAYLYVLRIATLVTMIIYTVTVVAVIPFIKPSPAGVANSLMNLPGVLITTAAWVTLVFAAIEFFAARYPEKFPTTCGYQWNPSSLPPLEKVDLRAGKPRSYTRAMAEIVFGFILLGWLLLIPRYPFLLMGPGVVVLQIAPFELAPVWWTFFWWVVALNAFQLMWKCVDLARGRWQFANRIQQIAFKVAGLIPVLILITARDHTYLLLKKTGANDLHYGQNLAQINDGIHMAFSVICVIVILQLAWDIWVVVRDAYTRHELMS
jgi:hypothetical protein